MAWEEIPPYKAAQLVNAGMLGKLDDNLNHVHKPSFAAYHHPGTGSNYTVSGSLGVDVDSTNFNLTVETFGGLVLVGFYGIVGVSAGAARMGIVRVDNISHIGRNLFYNYQWEHIPTTPFTVGGVVPFIGLPAGMHTFKLIWGHAGGGAATLYVAHRPRMVVVGW